MVAPVGESYEFSSELLAQARQTCGVCLHNHFVLIGTAYGQHTHTGLCWHVFTGHIKWNYGNILHNTSAGYSPDLAMVTKDCAESVKENTIDNRCTLSCSQQSFKIEISSRASDLSALFI